MHPILPYGVMGILALIAGLLCLLLPETRFKPTLENIDQEKQEPSTETGENNDEFLGTDEREPLVPPTDNLVRVHVNSTIN